MPYIPGITYQVLQYHARQHVTHTPPTNFLLIADFLDSRERANAERCVYGDVTTRYF